MLLSVLFPPDVAISLSISDQLSLSFYRFFFVSQMMTSEGLWLLLDKTSSQSYCFDTEGDAWCLACSVSGEVYLRSQLDIESSFTDIATSSTNHVTTVSQAKGFDFTSASRSPVFSAFSTVPQPGKSAVAIVWFHTQ